MKNKQKRLLLLGGSHSEIPLILAAQALGFYVITTGNQPQGLGHTYADAYHCADFSDCEAMLALARNLRVDALCAGCNDFAAISCAYAAERLHIPGHDSYATALVLHHKDAYRRFARDLGIPCPQAHGYDDIASACQALDIAPPGASTPDKSTQNKSTPDFQYPLMIKPVDLSGGKGISKVETPEQAKAALVKAFAISKSHRVVIEDFVTGSNHGFSAFLHQGKIVFHFTDDEHYAASPYLVSGASSPTSVDSTAVQELIQQSEKIATALNLVSGILHIQFILSEGRPVILEICRRAPGDLYVDLVSLATGVDYPHWIVQAATGMSCDGLVHHPAKNYVTRHCIMGTQNGRLSDVSIDPVVLSKITEKLLWWQPGDEIADHQTHKHGIVFVQYSSATEMRKLLPSLPQKIVPVLE
ncbi:MAG: ATP-grasp domain-containing protein [Kofleriaceae bacterium]|nr:ATP-grasp domain-containing protein [Kofleriaceae bacterium]